MGWAIKIGTNEYNLDDIPITEFQAIATRHGLSWLSLLNIPGQNAAAYIDILATVCKLHPEAGDIDIPAIDGGIGTVGKLLELLVEVDDELPDEVVDGVPLEAAPATTG